MSEQEVRTLLQGVLQQFQQTSAPGEVTGVAGGGAVTVTLRGLEAVTAVSIDPDTLGDPGLLEELVASAVNSALALARASRLESASGLLQGLGLEGGGHP